MGEHTNRYMLIARMKRGELRLFSVYGLERARECAARLERFHPIAIQDMSTGALVAEAVEVVPVSVEAV